MDNTNKAKNKYRPICGTEAKKIIQSVPFDKVYKYIQKQYEELDMIPKTSNTTKYVDGMMKRLMNISTIKAYYEINSTGINIIVFKLNDSATMQETNYGFLFAFDFDVIPDDIKRSLYIQRYDYVKDKYAFMHFSFSYSYNSADGEYRNRLVRWNEIMDSRSTYREIWDDIEQHILNVQEARGWSYHPQVFPSNFVKANSDSLSKLSYIVKNESYPLMFLAATWFLAMWDYIHKITDFHMNKAFHEIMYAYVDEDVKFFNNIAKKHGSNIDLFRTSITTHQDRLFVENMRRRLQIGFKIIPIGLSESNHPFDMRYKSWREYMINNAISDLVINLITPGIPLHGSYYIVQNTRKGFYDNPSQYSKIQYSELTKEIIANLINAKKAVQFAVNINNIKKQAKKVVENIISASTDTATQKTKIDPIEHRFRHLDNSIDDTIQYASNEIIMSDMSLMMVSENIGRTIASTLQVIETNKQYNKEIGDPLENLTYLHKYLFEIYYTLLSVNKHFGLIHADLHLNNATIGQLYQTTVKDACVTYTITDKTFTFPNNSYFGGVIDFSHGIIHVDYYKKFTHKGFDSAPLSHDINAMTAYDKQHLLSVYLRNINMSNYREEISVVMKSNYDAFFKIMTMIDVYMFTSRLSNVTKKSNIKTWLEKIVKYAEMVLTNQMLDLIKGTITAEWPIERMLFEFFSDYLTDSKFTVIDSYKLDNNLHFSATLSTMLPDGIKSVKYEDTHGKIVDVKTITEIRKNNGLARDKSLQTNFVNVVSMCEKNSIEHELEKMLIN